MQHYKKNSLFLIVFSILIHSAVDVSAQSSAFPAYSPNLQSEEKASTQPGKSAFPVLSTSESPDATEKYAFPESEPEQKGSPTPNRIDFRQLGEMLSGMKLEPAHVRARYDFLYLAKLEGQEVELSLSVFLGKEDSLVHIRAWLDPLPETGVPAHPLLEMLSWNEKMNPGFQFGYSKQAQRFLLETTLPNLEITPERLSATFQEISSEVASSWELWATSQWEEPSRKTRKTTDVPDEIVSEVSF